METTTTKETQVTKYETLMQQMRDAQQLQWVASQTRDAAAVARLDRELELLYREIDKCRAGH